MNNQPTELAKALALLISSTHTRTRPVSIVKISKAINVASEELGSLGLLSERINLSEKMLRQFMKVEKLCDEIKELVDTRKIDSVDAVSHLAQLDHHDQTAVAAEVLTNKWRTFDVRAFLEARKRAKEADPIELIQKINNSRTEKTYAFEFVARGGIGPDEIERRLSKFVPSEFISAVEVEGTKAGITVNQVGYDLLKAEARSRNMPMRSIISNIIF